MEKTFYGSFEIYARTNKRYHFLGHYKMPKTNKNQVVTITRDVGLKNNIYTRKIFYTVYNINTKETEHRKALR
jgi:hypothetical protein